MGILEKMRLDGKVSLLQGEQGALERLLPRLWQRREVTWLW